MSSKIFRGFCAARKSKKQKKNDEFCKKGSNFRLQNSVFSLVCK